MHMSGNSDGHLSREQIQERIPHRDPFLWLDEVIAMDESHITARTTVRADLDLFRGHYPHFPVFPGVMQCEAAMQAGAVLIASRIEMPEGQVPVATRLNNVQFRRMVRPGETMLIDVELTETLANAFFLKGKVSVDGQVSLRLEFACATAAIT